MQTFHENGLDFEQDQHISLLDAENTWNQRDLLVFGHKLVPDGVDLKKHRPMNFVGRSSFEEFLCLDHSKFSTKSIISP